jgi:hypothetical protein
MVLPLQSGSPAARQALPTAKNCRTSVEMIQIYKIFKDRLIGIYRRSKQ